MTTYVVTDYDGLPNITAGKRYKVISRTNLFFTIHDDVNSPTGVPRVDHGRWTVIEEPDTPKTWGEMTDAEKGALLLAHHEGKVIQLLLSNGFWADARPDWADDTTYRINPDPVVGEVVLTAYYDGSGPIYFGDGMSDPTNTLTLPTLDGKLVTGEFANEDGMKVVIEEKK